eukprot:CAMPEP_0119269296 /NCGR_PEP_ID=MMETSP1329-20130426/6767_1 /TAXON_ID=114041 /ORGANISM="Genus nov. species nov., Strain RCC1024" /LENGTH=105 /DNA_ID=CAMNT_0007269293 /DNA_START=141 /DNA_END=454 /DNA_ORIENTATION=+
MVKRTHTYEKDGVGEAPVLADVDGAVKASAPPGGNPYSPAIDPSPELETVILHFGPTDYLTMGTFWLANSLGGWRYGAPIRAPTAATMGMLGGLAGFLLCYANTS